MPPFIAADPEPRRISIHRSHSRSQPINTHVAMSQPLPKTRVRRHPMICRLRGAIHRTCIQSGPINLHVATSDLPRQSDELQLQGPELRSVSIHRTKSHWLRRTLPMPRAQRACPWAWYLCHGPPRPSISIHRIHGDPAAQPLSAARNRYQPKIRTGSSAPPASSTPDSGPTSHPRRMLLTCLVCTVCRPRAMPVPAIAPIRA
jgi:hypothetical protein